MRLAVGGALAGGLLSGCSMQQNTAEPMCPLEGVQRNLTPLILMAQAVPSAAYVPCISQLPPGWSFGGEHLGTAKTEFWLDSDRAGLNAFTVSLTRSCDVSDAVEVPQIPAEQGMERYEEPDSLPPSFRGSRYFVFPGGCITYRFSFGSNATFAQAVEIGDAMSFVARAEGVAELLKDRLVLCGRSAPPCPG